MTSAVEFYEDRPDKSAHATAGITTALFLVLLLLLLWLIPIVTPIPPFPSDPEAPVVQLFDFGAIEGGNNMEMGGGSQGNTGQAGAQTDNENPTDGNPSQTGAITNENSEAVSVPSKPTPGRDASVSDATLEALNKLKNKKNNTAVSFGGQGNSGPYSTGIGDGNGIGVGPNDGGIPGDGGGNGGGKTIRITYSPDVANPTQEEGVVSVRVSVNREGTVIKAEATAGGSTTGNPQLKATATQSAYKVRFNADDDRGEIVQCIISFNFTLQK